MQGYVWISCTAAANEWLSDTFTKIISLAKRTAVLLYTPNYFGSADTEPKHSPGALCTEAASGEGFLTALGQCVSWLQFHWVSEELRGEQLHSYHTSWLNCSSSEEGGLICHILFAKNSIQVVLCKVDQVVCTGSGKTGCWNFVCAALASALLLRETSHTESNPGLWKAHLPNSSSKNRKETILIPSFLLHGQK